MDKIKELQIRLNEVEVQVKKLRKSITILANILKQSQPPSIQEDIGFLFPPLRED